MLRSEDRAASAQSFTLSHQATIEITCHDHSIIACSRHIDMGVVLRAHPVRGESNIQRNPSGRLQQWQTTARYRLLKEGRALSI